MITERIIFPTGREAGPEVRLLDASPGGLDAADLRAAARALTARSAARHVTRSYRHPYALVAWYDAPVGVDIERIGACDAAFAESISTPSERADSAEPTDADTYRAALWCSKEALSKGLGDPIRYDPRRLESPMSWPEGVAGPWRAIELVAVQGHTAWLCWRSGSPAPSLSGFARARSGSRGPQQVRPRQGVALVAATGA